jgi:beta-N-acetylhexosaminidase
MHRRRRLGALGAVASAAALLGAIVGAGGSDSGPMNAGPDLPAQCTGSSAADVRRILGAKLIVRSDGTPDDALVRAVRAGEVGGVIVFPAEAQPATIIDEETGEASGQTAIRRGLRRLQAAAAQAGLPALVIATDQEGGEVKRFIEAPPLLSPFQLGENDSRPDARLEGRATGNFLAGMGINTDLAPVLDVPTGSESVMALRTFGTDPQTVTRLGLAFAEGLRSKGVAATAKHFPGLGRSTLNTDFAPSEIDAPRRQLRSDLQPFAAAIDADIELIMVGLASYPGLGAREPAALEPAIAQDLLRDRLGYEGVSITDDLQAEAIEAQLNTKRAAVAAARAGVDLLLFAGDRAPGALDALTNAVQGGNLDLEAQRASCARIVALREGFAAQPESGPTG